MLPAPERFNPFPGLRPFEPEENHLFFGRDDDIEELLRRLRSTRFLGVIGGSGSGKSSLVRSGLIPCLHRGHMTETGSSWRVAIMRPGGDPMGNLADVLSGPRILGQSGELADTNRILVETTLRRSNLGLIDCIRQARLPARDNLLVVVDQFEELFRFRRSSAAEARDESVAFVKRLLAPMQQTEVPIYVLITMRSDFIGDCIEYPALPEAINAGQYLIPRMSRSQLRSAITEPVAVGGGQIAPRLVVRLLNEVGDDPDQLPVLQHALMRTWDYWMTDQRGDEPLDLRHYEAIGTMREALSRHAEEAYAELGHDRERAIAGRLFRALTDTTSDTRGARCPASVAQLSQILDATPAEVIAVADCFRKAKRSFLTPPAPMLLTSQTVIDLSHESLMRIWDRLVVWASDEKVSAESYVHVAQAAKRYEEGKAGLWRDPELELGLQWQQRNQPTEAWAVQYHEDLERSLRFLELSKQERDRQVIEQERSRKNKLRMAWGISLVLLLFTIYALVQKSEAERTQKLAEHNLQLAKRAVDSMLTEVGRESLADVPQMEAVRQELLEKARVFYDLFLDQKPEDPGIRMETALAHSRLGDIYRLRGQNERAQASYQAAIEQLTSLQQQYRIVPDYMFQLANAYNQYGEYLRPYDSPKAEQSYDRALSIATKLVEQAPDMPHYQLLLALIYNNRGILFDYDAIRSSDAEASYRKAIEILQVLHRRQDDPIATLRLTQTLNNLAARLRLEPERREEAESTYLRAIQIMDDLLKKYPGRREYQEELAKFYNNMGNLLITQAKFPQALVNNQRAVGLFEALATPVRGLRNELANSYNSRGSILAQLSRKQPSGGASMGREAAHAYAQAIQIFQTLERDFKDFAEDPDSNARYANALANLGRLELQSGNFGEAERLLLVAIRHYLAALNSRAPKSSYRQQLASIYWLLSETHLRSGDHQAAVTAAELLAGTSEEMVNDYQASKMLVRAIELAETDPALSEKERDGLREAYGRQAIRLLRDALAAGYSRGAFIRDSGVAGPFHSLRKYRDFHKLLE